MTGKQPKRKPRPGIDVYGRVPGHYSAASGDLEPVVAFLDAGGNPNAQDDNGLTMLHFAAQGRHIEVTRVLLARGADPNIVDAHGNGPLWTAVMNARGELAVVRLLVRAGADTGRANKHGRSPLDMANTIGHGLVEALEE